METGEPYGAKIISESNRGGCWRVKAALLAMKGFRFDTIMFPISFIELLRHGFGKDVLDLAGQQGVAVLAIKAMSLGAWPKDVEQTRKWWYRSVEEPQYVDLAVRYTLSQPGVVAAIPPSFLDLLDKLVAAAKNFRPISPPEVQQLQKMAQSCESIFQKDENQVTWHHGPRRPSFPDSPHENCCGHWT